MYGADTCAGGDNANDREKIFQITSTKLLVQVVTLSTKNNVNLTEQLDKGFKKSVYWNEYKSKIETETGDDNNVIRFPLDASFQGMNILFVLLAILKMVIKRLKETVIKKYFLPRVDITNYNALIDGRNFFDQQINYQIKKYVEIREIATETGDNYTTACLLDYQ